MHELILPKTMDAWKRAAFRLLIVANLLFASLQLFANSHSYIAQCEIHSNLGTVELCSGILLFYVSLISIRIYTNYSVVGLFVGFLCFAVGLLGAPLIKN
jgi:hypothetical protein